MRFTQIHSVLMAVILISTCAVSATAGTKVLTFGWEDETSTVLGDFISGSEAMATYANVTAGSEVDYGGDPPFDPPVQYDVSPSAGTRMLEISIDPVDEVDSDAVRPFLAYVEHLDDGDLIQYSIQAYDPSEGRSPSVLIDGTYAQNGDITSFAGFFGPPDFQPFPPGTGWLDVIFDNEPDGVNFPVNPDVPFDEGEQGDREALVLRARPFRPTLSTVGAGGSGSYKYFIDDLRISVTSDNPLAQITLPDGSTTLVNGGPTVTGDYNDSGAVEQGDLDLVLLNWGKTWPPEIPGWINDQPTDDKVIDQNDLDGVLLNWGNTAASAAAVPEPSALLLLAAGLLLCHRVRK